MITIKNSKGQICDHRIPYNVDIKESVENMDSLIEECKQLIEECKKQFYEITMIPSNRI